MRDCELDEAARLILAATPYGPLHLMTCDGDMDDASLLFCAGLTEEHWSEADRACLATLGGMSRADRVQAWERAEAA